MGETQGDSVSASVTDTSNAAVTALDEGVADAEQIDRAMVLATGHPIGPLALADRIGLDVVLAILKNLYLGLEQETYRPHPLLEKYVRQHRLGKKTGEGFYRYNQPARV